MKSTEQNRPPGKQFKVFCSLYLCGKLHNKKQDRFYRKKIKIHLISKLSNLYPFYEIKKECDSYRANIGIEEI